MRRKHTKYGRYAHVSSPAVVPLFEHCSCAHLCLLNNMQSYMSSSCIHIALVDCNNFFVSCERLFRPDLAKKPVIVLSSNDGCVISRSNEARVLGFKMGEPYFSVKETCVTQGVAVFSSNFPLYRDISRRVMHTLARFSEHVETYSIDEAFLEPPITSCEPLEQWACSVRRALLTEVGVPVSVGIAKTKTLAKIAVHSVKKIDRLLQAYGNDTSDRRVFERSVCVLTDPDRIARALSETPIEDIWGVGARLAPVLRAAKFSTAYDLVGANDAWVRARMSVRGLRTVCELRGSVCFPVGESTSIRKTLVHSQSFGAPVYDHVTLARAVAHHARKSAEILRAERVVASTVRVCLFGVRGKQRDVWQASESLTVPTNDTLTLVRATSDILARVYRAQVRYTKAGVFVEGIVHEESVPSDTLFGEATRPRVSLMRELDELRHRLGAVIRVGAECGSTPWKARHTLLSPHYTTAWSEVVRVRFS